MRRKLSRPDSGPAARPTARPAHPAGRASAFALTAALVLGAAASGIAGPGYLHIGPPPLRYQRPPSPSAPVFVMPPLEPVAAKAMDPEAAGEGVAGDSPTPGGAAAAQAPDATRGATDAAQSSAAATTSGSAAGSVPAPPGVGLGAISPQLLVPYFTDSSAPAPTAVIAPVTFLPPQPAPMGRSQASYRVAP